MTLNIFHVELCALEKAEKGGLYNNADNAKRDRGGSIKQYQDADKSKYIAWLQNLTQDSVLMYFYLYFNSTRRYDEYQHQSASVYLGKLNLSRCAVSSTDTKKIT